MNIHQNRRSLNRRDFLKLLGMSGLATLLTRCGLLKPGDVPPAPTDVVLPTGTAAFTAVPTSTVTATQEPTPGLPAGSSQAATAKVESYNLDLIRRELAAMLDSLGTVSKLIKPGARIGIKPNLTAGAWIDSIIPAPATEMYATHPAIVQALAELLIEAGAGKIMIMEGMYDNITYQRWGYEDAARATGAELVDLCVPAPYADFIDFPVGSNPLIYDKFRMNALLGEIDVFISVAKMKCHTTTGVTLSMKNLFGIPPVSLYRLSEEHNNRSAFHGNAAYDTRVPRVIMDLLRARPIDLAIIDGISTVEAGAGPWNKGVALVKPGALIASFDPVAADAVSTAIMGFNPEASSQTVPFDFSDNHLALASEMGLGNHALSKINIQGLQVQELLHPFKPAQAL